MKYSIVTALLGPSSFGRKFRYAHRGRVTFESGSMVLLQILWNNFVDSSIADQQTVAAGRLISRYLRRAGCRVVTCSSPTLTCTTADPINN